MSSKHFGHDAQIAFLKANRSLRNLIGYPNSVLKITPDILPHTYCAPENAFHQGGLMTYVACG
jgi:hypothetical protein